MSNLANRSLSNGSYALRDNLLDFEIKIVSATKQESKKLLSRVFDFFTLKEEVDDLTEYDEIEMRTKYQQLVHKYPVVMIPEAVLTAGFIYSLVLLISALPI